MKFTIALVSLVAAVSATSVPAARGELVELPSIDVSHVPDRFYLAGGDKGALSAREPADSVPLGERATCPRNYPYLCAGRCCRYNICCKKQCCLPSTDFCSKGLCYRWT